MKHILNDLTDQEKNAIREQHSGGMKVRTEKFSKLLNTKSGTVRPLVSEQDNVEPRYKHRLGHQDRWYDEDDRVSDDFEDYDDEFEFGPDDYDSFSDMVGGFDNKWNPSFRKHYYDKYTETSPLKIRRKQMVQEAMSNAKNPKNKNMMVAITNCIKENKFTHLAILTTGAGSTILGSLAALFVSGVGTLPALLLLAAGVIITTIEGLLTSKEANLGGSSVTQELQQLIGCLKKKGAL